ncbi:hypothetical protein KDA23_00440 [Candidatus Saccharibacteria bacterium]|nr:hypothetical protein [Candidatus Saccharibacteria bacterium]
MPEILWYLGTILLFCGLTIAIELMLAGRKLRGQWLAIWIVTGIAAVVAVTERFALQWQAWGYNTAHILDIRIFGAELETYLFSALTALPIAIATVLLADREENKQPFPTFGGVLRHLWAVFTPKSQK